MNTQANSSFPPAPIAQAVRTRLAACQTVLSPESAPESAPAGTSELAIQTVVLEMLVQEFLSGPGAPVRSQLLSKLQTSLPDEVQAQLQAILLSKLTSGNAIERSSSRLLATAIAEFTLDWLLAEQERPNPLQPGELVAATALASGWLAGMVQGMVGAEWLSQRAIVAAFEGALSRHQPPATSGSQQR